MLNLGRILILIFVLNYFSGGLISVPVAYCSKSLYNAKHSCPSCKAKLGTYQKAKVEKDEKKAKKEAEKQAKKEKKEQEKQAKKDKK